MRASAKQVATCMDTAFNDCFEVRAYCYSHLHGKAEAEKVIKKIEKLEHSLKSLRESVTNKT